MVRASRILGLFAVVILLGLLVGWFRTRRPERAAPKTSRGAEGSRQIPGSPAETKTGVTPKLQVAPERIQRLLALTLPADLQRPGANSFAEALRLLGELAEGEDRSAFFQRLIAFGIEHDPGATLEALAALPDARLRDFGVLVALGSWSNLDPATALLWAAEHPRAENDHGRFHAAYESYAAHQPLEALQMLARPELAGDIDALSASVIFQFNSQNRLDEARTWIEQLPDGNLRELLVLRVMNSWGLKSPEAAVAWLASTASDATFRDGLGALVHTLAETDPRFAAGLTQKFPDPKIQQDFLADVIYLWARHDLGGAAAWMREQRPAPQLDAARARMAEATAKFDPAEATAWADTIDDAQKRADVLRRLRPGG